MVWRTKIPLSAPSASARAFSRPAPDVGGLSAKRSGDPVEAVPVTTPAGLFRILDVGYDDREADGEGKEAKRTSWG